MIATQVILCFVLVAGVLGDKYDQMRVRGADRTAIRASIYDVMSYGAVGNGVTKDTDAIQAAIDACDQDGGGTVFFPPGYVFLTGSIYAGSNMALYISRNTTLLGSANYSDYPLNFYSRYGGTMGYGHASLINAAVCLEVQNSSAPGDNCLEWTKKTNLILEGGGTINGQGAVWWDHCTPTCPDGSNNTQRPTLLGLLWVNGLTIDNLHLANSPMWTTHPTFCQNVLIANLNITAPSNSPNTDGIDPDSCSNVFIADCNIGTGDDCIAIKSGKDLDGRAVNISSNNILVEHCHFTTGHGISIGSEMSGNVTNVVFRNCTCDGTETGARIKTMRGRGGIVEDVIYEFFELTNVGQPISINMEYQSAPPTNASATPTFRNFTISNFFSTDTTGNAGEYNCLPESPCTEMTMINVDNAGGSGYQCQNAFGSMVNVNPEACLSP